MKEMEKKLRRGKGFTLVEMLIVVAIVAVLVAVSIPLVSSSLERARDATDQANERAAKAAMLLAYMGLDDSIPTVPYDPYDGSYTYFYDAEAGKLVDAADTVGQTAVKIKPYGQCTKKHDPDEHLFASVIWGDEEDTGNHVGKIIWIMIQDDGSFILSWVKLNWD